MKKTLKRIIGIVAIFLVLVSTVLQSPEKVKAGANDTTITTAEDWGYYLYSPNFLGYQPYAGLMDSYYINGQLGYCVDPYTLLSNQGANQYSSQQGWSNPTTTTNYIDMVGYYGLLRYQQTGDKWYYAAAQDLIWRALGITDLRYSTYYNDPAGNIDISGYKTNILSYVNNYNTKPSFNGQFIKGRVGDTIVLTDTNAILSDYEITVNSNEHNVVISGNSLHITLNSNVVNGETITLTRKHFDNTPMMYYTSPGSQAVVNGRIAAKSQATIDIQNYEYDTPYNPEKKVDTEWIELEKDFTYSINHKIDPVDPQLYYKSYEFTDQLESVLEYVSMTITRVNTTDNNGVIDVVETDVTNLFDIVVDKQLITATAQPTTLSDPDFYDATYRYDIITHTKPNADLKPYKVKDYYEIPNFATITIDNISADTNIVTVKYKPEEIKVPATSSSIPLLISSIAVVLIIGGLSGYYYVNRKKKTN